MEEFFAHNYWQKILHRTRARGYEGARCAQGIIMKKQNVFIAGGGTGGHVYPALVIGRALQKEGYNIFYIGTSSGIEAKVIPQNSDFKFIKIGAKGLRGSILDKFLAVFFLFFNIIKTFFLTLIHNPRFIVGTGGYVSAPAIISGALLGKKTFLLEQNYIPGKTTKFLSRFSKKVFVSFPATLQFIKKGKAVFTGNPVREEILNYEKEKAREKLGLLKDEFTILVTGASQGAKSINEAVINSLDRWLEKRWQIIHLTGDKNFEEALAAAQKRNFKALKYMPLAYLEDIYLAYAAADLVICRSGATTIAEITLRGLPSALVPYPYAAENHQYYNALYLQENNAGIIIEDKDIKNKLAEIIEKLSEEKDKLAEMSKNSLKISMPDAVSNILKEIKSS